MSRLLSLIIIAILSLPTVSLADGHSYLEVGVRGGTDATGVRENYTAAEAYLLYLLPWQFEVADGTTLRTRFDTGVGTLESDGDDGAWFAFGADLVLSLWNDRVELEAGFRPTWLTDYQFGTDDLGGNFQFSSHVGVALLMDPVTLSYRFIHISNAGIHDENPGLDLHLAGVGYRF